ncbi:MAG: alpha/beta hydrolase [Acidobacteriota bacterium]
MNGGTTNLLADVPEAERARLASFEAAHPVRHVARGDRRVDYLSGGRGPHAILILTAAHATPRQVYDTALRLEREYRVVVIDVGEASSLDDLARDVDAVLDSERISRVVAFGQSVAGILAQANLMRRPARVEAMVLSQTVAPRRENNKLVALWILRVLPQPLLRALLVRKLQRLTAVDLPPAGAARLAMSRALLRDTVGTVLTKKRIMATLHLLFEFNREEDYGASAHGGWRGLVLLVTAEDDGGFRDVERVSAALPRTEVLVLPTGAGHLATLVHDGVYFARVEQFLRSVADRGRK